MGHIIIVIAVIVGLVLWLKKAKENEEIRQMVEYTDRKLNESVSFWGKRVADLELEYKETGDPSLLELKQYAEEQYKIAWQKLREWD